MTKFKLLLYFLLILILLCIIVSNIFYFKQNKHFLNNKCTKGVCYKNFNKCYSLNGYVYKDTANDKKIERKTLKCLMDNEAKYKLLKLENILVPSLMNGTFCDILYTTYYDYNDFTILRNRIHNLNMPLTKCVRIRNYHFQPGKYFEIKYNGGTKIRALIDDNFNLLEEDKIDNEYKETVQSILDKIKQKLIKPIFENTYKRMSFIYKNNPEMRITIDSNIEFFHNNIYNVMDKDVLEFKIPYSISLDVAQQYLQEINQLIGTKLKYEPFSKFEYYYYKVIMNQNK